MHRQARSGSGSESSRHQPGACLEIDSVRTKSWPQARAANAEPLPDTALELVRTLAEPRVFIYALIDVGSGEPRYVGASAVPEARLAHHLRKTVDHGRGTWRRTGRPARMVILEQCSARAAGAIEHRWINRLARRFELFNAARVLEGKRRYATEPALPPVSEAAFALAGCVTPSPPRYDVEQLAARLGVDRFLVLDWLAGFCEPTTLQARVIQGIWPHVEARGWTNRRRQF
jgi:hypothetical protein